MKQEIGGKRIGSGNKMQVELKNYERSTHDLSYLWRSSMSAGTIVPFMSELALPGDTFDIDLQTELMTHPTVGPLFGSFKYQLDVYVAPVRLYNARLNNNELGIGLKMSDIKIPQVQLEAVGYTDATSLKQTPEQINPSCIFSYLNIRGLGTPGATSTTTIKRQFNAIPWLAYWEIYKNYYANKQEGIGAVINSQRTAITAAITNMSTKNTGGTLTTIPFAPTEATVTTIPSDVLVITYSGTTPQNPADVIIKSNLGEYQANVYYLDSVVDTVAKTVTLSTQKVTGITTFYSYRYVKQTEAITAGVQVRTFDLKEIDLMRTKILQWPNGNTPFVIDKTTTTTPYQWPLLNGGGGYSLLQSQEGLGLKTYQSDLFNNWISTDSITGVNGISAVTAVSTASGSFTIDTLNLSRKVYDMLNRIAISGGTYDDWLTTVYTHDAYKRCTTPMYMGGLSKELVFQEVVSNSASLTSTGDQPLGQLAGRGVLSKKHKGGSITIKIDEPSYIIGVASLTPRLDYSQGNKWDMNLKTLDDFHKPALDEIGFQDLITDQMDFRDTRVLSSGSTGTNTFRSAGKQPAWLNYMTNVNQVRGNFAIADNEMFMTLNRRYEQDATTGFIKDLTTYIDPAKYNYIFAETARDAQNYWAQIAVNITARRKMSAKIMPNL